MASGLARDSRAPARMRRPWVSMAVALVAVAAVVAGELWAFREAPALATTKNAVATEIGDALARVVADSALIVPAD